MGRPVDDALDEQIEMLRRMIRSSRPHSGSEEAHDAWDDAIDKAYAVLDTVRAELERLRAERDALDRLRQQINKSRATYVPGTPEKYPATELRGLTVLEAEALLAQAEQLSEERDRLASSGGAYMVRALAAEAEVRQLREERDTTTPLHALREKNRELRASLEAAEAEVRRLTELNARERKARKAAEELNADAVVAARTNLEAQVESERAEVRRLTQENDELAEQAYQDRSKAQRLTEGLRELEEYTSALFTYAMECEQLLGEAGIELPDASRIHEPSVREPGELGEKVRALLSANPPQGDAAAGSSPSDGGGAK